MTDTTPATKWALITGVSHNGLGDALTAELLGRNISVIATALKLEQLGYLSTPSDTSTTVRLEKLELDVTNSDSIASAVAATQRITNGKLDMLVNNAGYGYHMPLLDCSIDDFRRNFEVNVFGLLAVTQACSPLVREARGVVVNQSSIAGLPSTYQPFIGCYEASKSAVSKMGDVMRVELAPFGVKVVTLETGDVRTHFWDNAHGAHAGLPSESLYLPIKKKAEDQMTGRSNPPGQHARERWAKMVVNDLLSARPPAHVRRGYLATTMWVVNKLFPYWVLDWLYARAGGFGELRVALAAQQGEKKTQ